MKEIYIGIINGRFLKSHFFDCRGNKIVGWRINQIRGNFKYDAPIGWIGIGLNVFYKYDNGENFCIGNDNSKGEWAVTYYGIAGNNNNIKRILGIIVKGGFRAGNHQLHSECEDKFHPGNIVWKGVYFSPSIKIAEMYAGTYIINEQQYKIVLMVRIKPSSIRQWICQENNFWIADGTNEGVRPYRILLKEI